MGRFYLRICWQTEKLWIQHHPFLMTMEEFRMFLQMNTEINQITNKFVLIRRCATRWGRGESFTRPKSGWKVWTLNSDSIEVESPHKTEMPRKCSFKASGEVKVFISRRHLQDNILSRNNLLFYLSEVFYNTEQSIRLSQPIGKIKIAGSYEDKPTLDLRKFQIHSS